MPDEKQLRDFAESGLSGRRREARAARIEANEAGGAARDRGPVPTDDAQAASEAMSAEGTLSRFPDSGPAPAGRQKSGDPPAPR